jgi:hypothetical protein
MNDLKNQNSKQYQYKDNSKIITDKARKDIEKLINIDDTHGTEAYYSNRYGWTLRKIIS